MACMMRVIDIGPIYQILDGTWETIAVGPHEDVVRQVKNLADPELTNPSVAFVAHSKGKVDT
jgi:anaerobic dimethyl sulfoxide reductase subunit B (iron-sulfur subunit)